MAKCRLLITAPDRKSLQRESLGPVAVLLALASQKTHPKRQKAVGHRPRTVHCYGGPVELTHPCPITSQRTTEKRVS